MSLKKYRSMRDFKKTREPRGLREKSSGRSFVVQEHHASHLHYDFRLELGGVLKSWAVPKGPSTNPKDKRLAVHVEDHPVSYRTFEGEIPKGEYGAGHVSIWDDGEWTPLSRHPLKDLENGRLEFELHGTRLKGRWLLVRTRGKESKQWLLLKRRDTFAKAKSSAVPTFLEPQLALLKETPPKGEDWIHEIKFDGYRTQCRIQDKSVNLYTRSGLDWTKKYGSLATECAKLEVSSAVLDGEIVCLDPQGRSDFGSLQKALKAGEHERLIYYVFDLLFLNGEDLSNKPLLDRKRLLKKLVEKSNVKRVLYSEHWRASGAAVLEKSCAFNLEGIISKRADLGYEAGRTGSWIKSKCGHNQEFVIIGFTEPEGSREGFGALLLAAKDDDGDLKYVGRVGTGFDSATLRTIHKKLSSIATTTKPIAGRVPSSSGATWVKPSYVAQVKFGAWTDDGILRHAVFVGLREDKPAREVEIDRPRKAIAAARSTATARREEPVRAKRLRLTNAERVIFPGSGLTKKDLADFYFSNAEAILKHIDQRPLSLLRCPQGLKSECFFQKHAAELGQDEVRREKIRLREREKSVDDILYVDSREGLHALAQIGVIELHAWGCHRPQIERPDLIVFDLDPDDRVDWQQIVEGALAIKETLEKLKLKSFLKVTGGKGLHLHVPIAPRYTWEQVKGFSKAVVTNLAQEEPTLYTINIMKAKRKGKIFLDYLRNGYGATAIAPYSVRAREHATIAMPVRWSDLDRGLKPDQFRLEDVTSLPADPWKGYYGLEQRILLLEA